MASRIKVTILDQMDMAIDSLNLWSDSKTALNYLRNTKKPISDLHYETMQQNPRHQSRRLEIQPLQN